MIDENFFIGVPYEFEPNFFIYPPTVEQVLTCKNFGTYSALLLISQEEIEDDLAKSGGDFNKLPTPFEFLLMSCYHDKQIEEAITAAFDFFCHTPITFLYEEKRILLGDIKQQLMGIKEINDLKPLNYLTDLNYFDFQNALRQAVGFKPVEPYRNDIPPRLKRMKALARYRDKVKAKQNSKGSMKTMLAALCCMGIGLTPLNIGQMSYAAVHSLISIYQSKEKYDIDIRSLLAGADSKKIHPVYWMDEPKD